MSKVKVTTDLPGFPGFYENSIFHSVKHEYWEDVAFEYFTRLNEEYFDSILTFEGLSSPKAYNYSTDTIKVSFTLSLSDLEKLDEKEFNKYCKEHGSYDGFTSFCPENKEDLIDKFKSNTSLDAIGYYYLNYIINKSYHSDTVYGHLSYSVYTDFLDNDPIVFEDDYLDN